jgi:hypothetical protein
MDFRRSRNVERSDKVIPVEQSVAFADIVEFRGLKQTLDRAKLRCRNDQRLLTELNWSIMAMAVAKLFALREQLAAKPQTEKPRAKPADPNRRSLANTIRALRRCLRALDSIPRPDADLPTLLRKAVTDSYQRKKPKGSRYRPQSRQEAIRRTTSAQDFRSGEKTTAKQPGKTGRINPSRRCLKGRLVVQSGTNENPDHFTQTIAVVIGD